VDDREIDVKMLGLQKISMSRPAPKLSTKERNDQKWEIHKRYIQSIYMDTDHTLKETMKIVADTYHFTARSEAIDPNSVL
jgi:hypothetical protein